VSLQFSRSVRALRIDSFRASRIGLALAILLMMALIAWFFFARVTLFEVSSTLKLTDDGRLIAAFSPDQAQRLRQGQAATLRLSGTSEQPALSFPAYLFSLEQGADAAELVLLSSEVPPNLLDSKLTGRVEVEVEYITPAEMLLRASGRYFNQSNISVSPGQGQEQNQP
jgi:hypothetical protein